MKNIHSKEEFLLIKEGNLNEGLLGLLKNMFKSIGKLYDKIKGGKELKQKIEDYKEKINKIFIGLTSAEQTKTAANKNAQAAIESKVYEADIAGSNMGTEDNSNTAPMGKGEDVKGGQPQPQTQGENTNLDSNQLKGKLNVSKDHIKQLQKSFDNEVEALKKKFTGKDGKVPKKLEYSILLAKNQITDFIFEKWEEHYTQIGDKKTIANIQKQRAQVAKEMKSNTEALQRMMSDQEQTTFAVDRIYKYTNSEGKVLGIKVKEVDENGNVSSAETVKGNPINPISSQITNDYYKKGGTYKYTGKQGETTVTILKIADNGQYQVKSAGGQTFMAPPEKLGFKYNPKTQPA